ncbi:MAG TPA: cupin domain-containing protein [Candidatus Baltobacteraceae bacterium]|jgi:uncharacterized cupin superfamily protein|nr:cupin domain-containing protein [Candidatus Baltobacteraceae bacterium]
MLAPLRIPNAYCFSQIQPGSALTAYAYVFAGEGGHVLVEPLLPDEPIAQALDDLGGLSLIVVMSEERREAARLLAARYGCKVVSEPGHRETIAPGMRAIALPDQHRANEFAVSIIETRTLLCGDTLLGTPAGALSLPAESSYADPLKGALGLRRIMREYPETILTSFGEPVFAGAYGALYAALHARAGAELLRINLDDLEFLDERVEHPEQPSQFSCHDAEVGFTIGARKLGYRVSTLEPGTRFCPLHGHAREEELFLVLDGEPSVRTLSGTIRCRKGDFIALPVGVSGTHQLLNESDAPATVLLLARTETFDVCYYPDSDKLLVDMPTPLIEGRDSLLIAASPQLDYFHGETEDF